MTSPPVIPQAYGISFTTHFLICHSFLDFLYIGVSRHRGNYLSGRRNILFKFDMWHCILPRFGFYTVWKRNWNRFRPQTVRQVTNRQCPYTLKAKDTRNSPSCSNSALHLAPPPSRNNKQKHQNRKPNAKHMKLKKQQPTQQSWHHSEQQTLCLKSQQAHHTKQLVNLGSTQLHHQPTRSITGLLPRTKIKPPLSQQQEA